MFDIITFGSATGDIFLRLGKEFFQDQRICFPLGGKFVVDDVAIFSGGGGTNSACTFASQGLKTAYVGKIGNDLMGRMVNDDLQKFKVSQSFLRKDDNLKTAFSVILSPSLSDRVILVYKGACHFLTAEEIAWSKIKQARWFYIAPLYGMLAGIWGQIVSWAKENDIKVAVNMSEEQMSLDKNTLHSILAKVDVLILNSEEAFNLAGVGGDEKEAVRIISSVCPAIIVITRGEKGSLVYDGKRILEAGVSRSSFVEKTGAGDAYGSGFVAGLLQKSNIEYAIQLATANSESCIQTVGAKNGLLLSKKSLNDWPKVEVKEVAI